MQPVHQAEWGSKEATDDDEDATFEHTGWLRPLSQVPGEKKETLQKLHEISTIPPIKYHQHIAHG